MNTGYFLIRPTTLHLNSLSNTSVIEFSAIVLRLMTACSLLRSAPVFNLYQYLIPESEYQKHRHAIMLELSGPHVEGVYELQTPLDFRILMELGSICGVKRQVCRFELTR